MADDSADIVKSLQAQLETYQKQLEAANVDLAPILEEETGINALEHQLKQEYAKQMQELREKRTALQNAKYAKQVAVNNAKAQAAIINQQIEAEKQKAIEKAKAEEAAKKAAEQYETLGKRFDTATMGAPWREWAKDHQIEAGKILVQDRNVILADSMGLGKTLSSIITADMAEKVTQDASPEFPFLGVEEEVYVPARLKWTVTALQAARNNTWPFTLNQFSRWTEVTIPSNPFDDPVVILRGVPLMESHAETVGYLDYDLKQRLLSEGMVENVPAHYETQIVNAIERPVGRKILYICPAPLLRNVMDEWRRWAPHRSVTYIGNMSKGERNFVLDLTLPKLREYVIIVNYEAWRRDMSLLTKLASCKFDTLIIDEAHMVKDMKSQAYKGVRQLRDELNPEYIIPMTGTPILNRPQELFSLLTLVNPKEFHTERDFLWRYCEEYYVDGSSSPKYKFKPGGLDMLAKKIRKNFLRRTKEQAGIILPERTIVRHELDRDDTAYPKQAKAREHMKKYATIVLDNQSGKAIQATVMIALLTRLRQIETWPAGIIQRDKITKEVILQLDVEESQKIDYVIRFDTNSEEWEGLIPDVIEDERTIVFSQFKAPLHELKKRVEKMGYKAAIFDGDTHDSLKEEIRTDFDRTKTPVGKHKYDVLLCNYRAAGVGLNLTGATNMIILDSEWNPGKRDQAFDRIHRIGQTEKTTINVVTVKNTIDQWLDDILTQKEATVNGFEAAMLNASDLKDALESGLI